MDWDALRTREFPVSASWVYLDHAAVGPLPSRSAQKLREWTLEQETNGCANWPSWERGLEGIRKRVAGMIGAKIDEIAFVAGTTHGIGLVAEGFPWRGGDNVVTASEEYPSNVYPWMNLGSRGVSVRRVPSRDGRIWVDDLAAAIDSQTRMLTISHVEFASGFRNDLDALSELCRSRGVALMVDAIQSLGALTVDLAKTPVDFLTSGGQKWLLGPEGTGFLYVRGEWIDRLRAIGVGSRSVINCYDYSNFDFRLKPNAQRWEGGAFNMPGLHTLGASLSLLDEIGFETVSLRILDRAERVRAVADRAGWRVFGSRDALDLSGIVSIEKPGVDAKEFVKALRDRKITAAWRGGRLRLSPHMYTSNDDIDCLAEALGSV